MLELGAGAGILRALGVSYIGLIIALVGVFLWFPRRGWVKALGVVTVLAIFIGPAYKRSLEREKAEAQSRARYEKAQTLFNKRCEGAGEKIHRVVQGVEGVVWMKWRDKRQASDASDQYKLFDPYGQDCTEESCILNLLRVTQGAEHNPERAQHHSMGYRYVEATPPPTAASRCATPAC